MTSFSTQAAEHDTVRALRWTERGLFVLDQRMLPESQDYQLCATVAEVAEAISSMRVRGAPALGIAAAYGVVLAARERSVKHRNAWRSLIQSDLELLASSRPTAVNLFWAIERMRSAIESADEDVLPKLETLARSIHSDDIKANRTMGEFGANLIEGAKGVLTHCNTGSLATGGYGTALGVIRSSYRRRPLGIFATETRPWLQGARLTLWELSQDGIPATLIADSAAGLLMRRGLVDWVIVGADRIAANGDTANKIGTYSLAVLARHHGIKFMVVAPTSTIDWKSPSGAEIVIEERDRSELLPRYYADQASVTDAWNPVFDVTPAALINAIVTEKGVVESPTRARLGTLLGPAT